MKHWNGCPGFRAVFQRGAVLILAVVLVFLTSCLVGCGGSSGSAPGGPVNESAVDTIVQPLIDSGNVPSVVVGIGNEHGLSFAKAYGLRDIAADQRARTDTRYWIGSVSKQFAAAGILRLQEQGLLSIEDLLSNYVPEYLYASQMTLRQIMTMTAGIVGLAHHEERIFNNDYTEPITAAEVIANLNKIPPFTAPDTEFDYANAGYYLLGLVIERVSDLDYPTFLSRNFFEPLNMRSSYIVGSRIDPGFAIGYLHANAGDPFLICKDLSPSFAFSAGGIVSTVEDLIKWDTALRAGRVLSPADFQTMLTATGIPAANLPTVADSSYALGWFIGPKDLAHHPGDTFAFHAQNVLFPDGYNLTILSNAQNLVMNWDSLDIAIQIHNGLKRASPFPRRPPLPSATPLPVLTKCPPDSDL
jgi:D-alanyl-D-alanine carboxypeptidase